jgi:hypothetical protein
MQIVQELLIEVARAFFVRLGTSCSTPILSMVKSSWSNWPVNGPVTGNPSRPNVRRGSGSRPAARAAARAASTPRALALRPGAPAAARARASSKVWGSALEGAVQTLTSKMEAGRIAQLAIRARRADGAETSARRVRTRGRRTRGGGHADARIADLKRMVMEFLETT